MATFLEKEQEILETLVNTDFAVFGGDEKDALETISESLDSFSDYAKLLIHRQNILPILRVQLQDEDYEKAVQELDTRLRNAHDNAIVGMSIMNRISKNLNLEPFAPVNTENRHAVAECVGQYVSEVYNYGIGQSFDDAAEAVLYGEEDEEELFVDFEDYELDDDELFLDFDDDDIFEDGFFDDAEDADDED